MRYLYKCDGCKKTREVDHKMSECDTHIEKCECGMNMGRVIVNGSFLLLGRGWFRDGYARVDDEGNYS